MEAGSKSILLSKTCFLNLALASTFELHPQLKPWAESHTQTIILIYTIMNVVLRHMTDGPIHWFAEKKKPLC